MAANPSGGWLVKLLHPHGVCVGSTQPAPTQSQSDLRNARVFLNNFSFSEAACVKVRPCCEAPCQFLSLALLGSELHSQSLLFADSIFVNSRLKFVCNLKVNTHGTFVVTHGYGNCSGELELACACIPSWSWIRWLTAFLFHLSYHNVYFLWSI